MAVGDARAAACLYDLLLPWRDQRSFLTAFVHSAVDLSLGELAALPGGGDEPGTTSGARC